jgi:hypothetical protein
MAIDQVESSHLVSNSGFSFVSIEEVRFMLQMAYTVGKVSLR